jgi:signal transduction histidine kinase/ActR/RegA family two-component response regulator
MKANEPTVGVKEIVEQRENRVLALLPTGRDAELVCGTLEKAGFEAFACPTIERLIESVAEGAGVLLIAEEALQGETIAKLVESAGEQPIWSDIPIIVFSSSSENVERLVQALSGKLNTTIVERPIRITLLVSAVRGALRARQRQYETRDLLVQLKEADKQKDLFLATLSHELRTPLNSIVGWIKLLRGKNVGAAELDHALDVIERNAKAQSEIIADILFVSRIVTGKLELKRVPTDLRSVVSGALDIVKPALEANGLTADTSIDIDNAFIEGDPDRLQQIFLNLLSNAVKFTGNGGKITVAITKDCGNALVSVTDTGRGIEPSFLPDVFDRFRQADSEYNRRTGGLGLGLAIVRHLAELHGGSVRAESKGLGQGSTFEVSFPLIQSQTASNGSVEHHEKVNSGQLSVSSFDDLRVLLVEDDTDSREMLKTFLEANGMCVTAVESAPAAIEAIKVMNPDILISDVGLPGQDGYEMMSTIRSFDAAEGGQTPAIALTGYVSLQDRKQALSSGFQEHLAKPIDFDELVGRIKRIAGKPRQNGGKSAA